LEFILADKYLVMICVTGGIVASC